MSQFPGNPYGATPGGPSPAAASKVAGPAIALMVVAGINILLGIYYLVVGFLGPQQMAPPPNIQGDPQAAEMFEMIQNMSGTTSIIVGLVGLLVAIVILMGAMKMKNLQSYGLAMTSSILAMIPCLSLCCLLGLPIGIWSIVVLNNAEVKSSFR
jgi:hypothetical protein